MIYLTEEQVLQLHDRQIKETGGSAGVLNPGLFASAVAQPEMGFGGEDVYPTLPEKVAALGYSLINNHAFQDGNKRTGFAAMSVFLKVNGWRLAVGPDEGEIFICGVAAGERSREELVDWIIEHAVAE